MPFKSILVTNIFKNVCEQVLQCLSSNCYKCSHSNDISSMQLILPRCLVGGLDEVFKPLAMVEAPE